jgi:MFS superfamily sulfate permease-like transporter
LAVIAFLAPTLAGLPKAVLAAIVVNAVWGLIDIAASAAAVGVLVAGPLLGLLFAIALSILGLVFRSSRVRSEVESQSPCRSWRAGARAAAPLFGNVLAAPAAGHRACNVGAT